MPFVPNSPLTHAELEHREMALRYEVGLSMGSLRKLQSTTPNLCEVSRAKRRIQNLKALGFDINELIERSPKVLDRRSTTVRKKFLMIRAWFKLLKCDNIDIHEFFMSRHQLWSVGPKKMHVICLLALHINSEVTADRLCNMFTQNLEEILCTYIDNQTKSFDKLCYQVRSGINVIGINWTRDIKVKYISAHRKKLPPLVCKKYFL